MTSPAELPGASPNAATPLVVIEDCVADQLIGTSTAHLASGTLQVFSGSPIPPPELVGSDTTEEAKPKGALTLQIGHAAFVLEPSLTTVFTHSENSRWYFWTLTLPSASSPDSPDHPSGTSVGSGSYVRLTLPEGVDVPGSALEKSRDAFEDILIGREFLSGDTVFSAADEIGRSVSQDANAAATQLKLRTKEHISSKDPASPTSQTAFSPTTHSFVEGTTKSSDTTASYSGWAAERFARASISVGERVAGLFGLHLDDEPVAQGSESSRNAPPAPERLFSTGDAFEAESKRDGLEAPNYVPGSSTPSEAELLSHDPVGSAIAEGLTPPDTSIVTSTEISANQDKAMSVESSDNETPEAGGATEGISSGNDLTKSVAIGGGITPESPHAVKPAESVGAHDSV